MSEKNGFQLRTIPDILKPADPLGRARSGSTYNLPLDSLQPFKNHPFRLYEGERFTDMVESIRANGVLVPIIVRQLDNSTCEILSGHNRAEASKAAGLKVIPAIVREDLTDDEALLIVTETNLIQRSFSDLSHSERAVTLAMHHEAVKHQGKRTDLINEIENMVNASSIADSETLSPLGTKLDSKKMTGDKYDLSSRTVARYLRINKLIQSHKNRLDNGELSVRTAVTLSYLSEDEQQIVDDVMRISGCKTDMKKAELLRNASQKKIFTREYVEQILSGLAGKKKNTPKCVPAFSIKSKVLSKYFKPGDRPEDIETVIIKALELYYSQK